MTAANQGPGSQNPDSQRPNLRDFSGLLVLVGAGKMGGALLEGWLRLGLDPRNVVVLEPAPLAPIAALVSRGMRLNPDAATLRDASVVVIALKPQAAAEARSEERRVGKEC